MRYYPAMSKPFAIRFDFPEAAEPLYAGTYKDALGFAPTLATALMFSTVDAAAQMLDNGYGHASVYGRVVPVEAGYPVA